MTAINAAPAHLNFCRHPPPSGNLNIVLRCGIRADVHRRLDGEDEPDFRETTDTVSLAAAPPEAVAESQQPRRNKTKKRSHLGRKIDVTAVRISPIEIAAPLSTSNGMPRRDGARQQYNSISFSGGAHKHEL